MLVEGLKVSRQGPWDRGQGFVQRAAQCSAGSAGDDSTAPVLGSQHSGSPSLVLRGPSSRSRQ